MLSCLSQLWLDFINSYQEVFVTNLKKTFFVDRIGNLCWCKYAVRDWLMLSPCSLTKHSEQHVLNSHCEGLVLCGHRPAAETQTHSCWGAEWFRVCGYVFIQPDMLKQNLTAGGMQEETYQVSSYKVICILLCNTGFHEKWKFVGH